MRYICSKEIDFNNTFFHFSRIDNRESIEQNGLQAVAGGENETGNDKDNKTIYFSKGISGILKAVDVWARWEYDRYVSRSNQKNNYGHQGYDKKIMKEVIYKKLYNDFKERQYYTIDLIEGVDFEYGDVDVKKMTFTRDENGIPYPSSIWKYGPYSDFGTIDNPNNKQEDWNMNTKIGERTILSNRLKIIETETGRTDALSFILESYDKYRAMLPEQYNEMFEILDNFITYAKERYKNDKDFADGMPDIGRREINLEKQEYFQKVNKITPITIVQTGIQYMQEHPGLVSDGVKRASNILGKMKEKNNDKSLSE